MRWRTTAATTLLACLASAAPARSAVAPPDTQILREVARTYRALDRYLLQGVIRVDVRGSGKPLSQEVPFLVAVDGRGRLRDEVASGAVGGMLVSDGRQTVIYNAQLGQYVRRRGSADSLLASDPGRGLGRMLITRYGTAADGATGARRLPDETVTLAGARRDCVVLEVTYAPSSNPQVRELPRTYWIDKQTHLVLRQRSVVKAEVPQLGGLVEQEENITFRRALIDPPLPDSLWVFRPPGGSREVAEFTAAPSEPGADFTGRPAIDFTLKDLKGTPHSLRRLRGKTVLLDFWASWCGPCRMTMPQVAKIHAEYKHRGVEVMSINVGEPAEKAGAYMKKHGYLFTTLLDVDRTVSSQYRVSGIPTLVVIDRAGTVSDYLVGVRDDVALRAALKKAGVK